MIETQQTISQWAEQTFGPAGSNLRVAVRANQEMAELLTRLAINDNDPAAATEIADIVITLYRVATRLNKDIDAEVQRKMAINRAREWELDGSGCGQHK